MAPFLILSLLPFLISPSLSSITSCTSDQFSVLLRQRLRVSFSSLFSQAPLARRSCALPSVLLRMSSISSCSCSTAYLTQYIALKFTLFLYKILCQYVNRILIKPWLILLFMNNIHHQSLHYKLHEFIAILASGAKKLDYTRKMVPIMGRASS